MKVRNGFPCGHPQKPEFALKSGFSGVTKFGPLAVPRAGGYFSPFDWGSSPMLRGYAVLHQRRRPEKSTTPCGQSIPAVRR
jgi:hypothetical protein